MTEWQQKQLQTVKSIKILPALRGGGRIFMDLIFWTGSGGSVDGPEARFTTARVTPPPTHSTPGTYPSSEAQDRQLMHPAMS